jgi:hypothetical protein
MFGFVVGFICLWALVRLLRRERGWYRRSSCGGSWHRSSRWRGPEDRRWQFLHRLFEELDTTPGQEKEIRAAIDEVLQAGENVKDGFSDTRGDLGRAFRNDELDAELLGTILSKQDAAIDDMREAMAGALGRIHAALDPEQRARLARWLERGPRWGRRGWGGPYRAYA